MDAALIDYTADLGLRSSQARAYMAALQALGLHPRPIKRSGGPGLFLALGEGEQTVEGRHMLLSPEHCTREILARESAEAVEPPLPAGWKLGRSTRGAAAWLLQPETVGRWFVRVLPDGQVEFRLNCVIEAEVWTVLALTIAWCLAHPTDESAVVMAGPAPAAAVAWFGGEPGRRGGARH